MDSVWVLGRSELEIRLASAEAGAVMERDHSTLRRGDEENHLALVSEWRGWKRNLALEQEKWRCWALQRELESCMFWVWFLAGLKLFLHGFSVNADTIYSKRADLMSWMNKLEQKI